MSSQTLQPVKILLVEDNLQDIEIARRAFAKGRVKNELIVVRDGQEALDYLYHQGKHKDPATSPRPGMILLDLNLPKVGGMEVLQQIKRTKPQVDSGDRSDRLPERRMLCAPTI